MDFSRSRKGYDTQEVDAVIDELQKQIADLKRRYAALLETLTQKDVTIQQQANEIQKLHNEHIEESLRITELLDTALKMAEQIKRDAIAKAKEITGKAWREAAETMVQTRRDMSRLTETAQQEVEKIRAQARAALGAIHTVLRTLSEVIQFARQYNVTDADTQLTALDLIVSNALSAIPAAPQSPPLALPVQPTAQPRAAVTPASPLPKSDADYYEDFVRKMMAGGVRPQHTQNAGFDELFGVRS